MSDPINSDLLTTATLAAALAPMLVVTVSEGTSSVTVKWGDEETTAPHTTVYADAPYSFSAVKANGKEPAIKTFGSLLHCGGGVLTIGETPYRVQKQQQPNGKLRCCFCILVLK